MIIIEEYFIYKYNTHSLTRLSFGVRERFSLLVMRTLNAEILFYPQCLVDSLSSHGTNDACHRDYRPTDKTWKL